MPLNPVSLPLNVMHFARILRLVGLPIGPGKVITALEALQIVDISQREDVFWALHAVLVKRYAHTKMFRLAFDRFWQAPIELSCDDSKDVSAKLDATEPEEAQFPGRLNDSFSGSSSHSEYAFKIEEDAAIDWSAAEQLSRKDFETMSTLEWNEAKRLIANMRLPIPQIPTRRFRMRKGAARIDMRATLSAMVRNGGFIDLQSKAPKKRRPPLVVLCDISGSMTSYVRMLLHFFHAITNDRDRVYTFLFGTRLTNVSRYMACRDPDDALSRISLAVEDWSGGTRIGETLGQFNRLWSRRLLGQGAVVLLITDGLDRDSGEGLSAEMRRLHGSCRRLIWLNPLLRYDAFEPKPAGIRAMLPHVDDFRPVHNLENLADLVLALDPRAPTLKHAA